LKIGCIWLISAFYLFISAFFLVKLRKCGDKLAKTLKRGVFIYLTRSTGLPA